MSQILRVSTSRSVIPNLILTAGDSQTSICAPIVYLEATISPDGIGHPTEWVQLNGTPIVELFTDSPTQAHYLVNPAAPGTDKTFRFYMDRNTPLETYADVTVYTTPASQVYGMLNGGIGTSVVSPPLALAQSSGYLYRSAIPFDSAIPMAGAGDLVSNIQVNWTLPLLYDTPLTEESVRYYRGWRGSIIEAWTGSTWQLAQTYATTDVRSYAITAASRIRVGNVYAMTGHPTSIVYNDWIDVDPAQIVMAAANATIAPVTLGVVCVTTAISKIIYTLDMQLYDDYLYGVNNGVVCVSATIDRFVYVLLPLSSADDLTSSTHGAVALKFTITRTSGGSLGG
jgi:hypothetical protein